MMTYVLIDCIILSIPLALTFERRVRYYRDLPAVIGSILVVGALFIWWDSVATARGDWSFNGRYCIGVRLWGLPLEEIGFFIVVPYSCLFIYEVLCYFIPERPSRGSRYVWLGIALVSLACAIVYRERAYTATVAAVSVIFAASVFLMRPALLYTRNFWLYLTISMALFVIFNYILTAVPIVIYNEGAVSGRRMATIPCEDFFYAYVLLSLYYLVYGTLKKRWQGIGMH